jgi:hypothetical protein
VRLFQSISSPARRRYAFVHERCGLEGVVGTLATHIASARRWSPEGTKQFPIVASFVVLSGGDWEKGRFQTEAVVAHVISLF